MFGVLMKTLLVVACLALGVFIISCSEDLTSDPSQSTTGVVWGKLRTIDLDGMRMDDYSGVLVELEGTGRSSTSNAEGEWRIENVPAGVYDITFSKMGFSSQKLFNQQFVGAGEYYSGSLDLMQLPEFSVVDVQMTPNPAEGHFEVSGMISEMVPAGSVRRIGAFYQADPNGPFEPYNEFLIANCNTSPETASSSFTAVIKYKVIPGTSGSSVTLRFCPMTYHSAGYSSPIDLRHYITGVTEVGSKTVMITKP